MAASNYGATQLWQHLAVASRHRSDKCRQLFRSSSTFIEPSVGLRL